MKNGKIAILILSLVLGIVMTIQFKTSKISTGGVVSSQKARQLSAELKSLKDKRENLQEELGILESKIKAYEESQASSSTVTKNLKEDIQRYEILAGYTDVMGPGVEITIASSQPGQDEQMLTYNYEMLLSLINKLNAAGAEAIAVNDERIVASTEIHLSADAGDKIVINDKPVKAPYYIKAIGNSDTLEAALNMRYGIVWEIRQYTGLKVDVKKADVLEILRYGNKIEFNYAQPVS
ncbi:hypothetical protein EAL2_c10500 [Peptoclostridium acidaminophilum DSM 3953]|uniref:Division initiation protein n=1 Tax=Peptoclostridium acidaminophilum DSM 3953 TaxID=1286171 RepID=W8TEU4_PEPAC|nr:DUF881 domain-containing protein [Peptoclostridium acidaminophilum]AHM56348.1 hypothetical protein EAL2_c10500 [Peptoclostridium acidaminophilum DSM 3953]